MRTIPFISVSLLILSIIWSCGFKSENPDALKSDYPEIDVFFNSIEHFSGNVLVAQQGNIIYLKSFGYADNSLYVENNAATKFRIGSISKPITAISIMALEEQGLIKVEEHLSKYMPDLPESWQEITIHQLLTHTSGLDHEADFEKDNNIWCAPSAIKEIFEEYQNMPLIDIPGKNFHYSNIGYFALSVLAEQVTGLPFDAYLEQEILRKLEMEDSGGDDPLKILSHKAKGYALADDGTLINAPFDNMLTKRGAGNMYATVEDLLKLKKAFTPDILLSSSSIAQMKMPYASDSEMGPEVNYGYGWDIKNVEKIEAIFHTGGVSGFESLFYYFPERDIVIVACANIRPKNKDWRSKFPELVYQLILEKS